MTLAENFDALSMHIKQRIIGWFEYLDEPVSGASLAVFRICFSILMLVLVFEYFNLKWIDSLSGQRSFHFAFVQGINALPGLGMHILLACLAVIAIFMGIGLFYRFSALLFFLIYSYIFLVEECLYQNHMYLIALLGFLMFIVPAQRVWSVDALRKKFSQTVPKWCVLILKFQFVVVYFYGGIAKLSWDWLQGHPLSEFLLLRASDPFFGPLFGHLFREHWFVTLISYGGIAVDLSIGFLLLCRRTFWLGASIALLFHLMNACMFNIDIFPWLMIASIGLFAPEDWPFAVLKSFRIKLSSHPQADRAPTEQPQTEQSKTRLWMMLLIHVYIAVQILVPMRRIFYVGDPCWDEQVHHFSWRMLLRDKRSSSFEMTVVDPRNGAVGLVHPQYTLSGKQMSDLLIVPHLMLHYAHFVADDFEQQAGVRPKVFVKAKVSLNGRPAQYIVDPKVDLAAESDSFLPAKWIMPLQQ
ncbi:MAG: HTTM domain-containing protein [Cyanobacteria bacterium SZAS-4]|nr:HTTM domain-containing protein [Cyanobacteria bacterium SZAS-4]